MISETPCARVHREYKKLTGEDPDPLMPQEMEKAFREMPRDADVLLKKGFHRGPASGAMTAKPRIEMAVKMS
jgi:hypothetical protein